MKRTQLLTILGLGLIFLSACATKTPAVSTQSETPIQATNTATMPTQPVVVEPAVDNCVTCHTDKQMLIDTTAPVEEVAESESEGVG